MLKQGLLLAVLVAASIALGSTGTFIVLNALEQQPSVTLTQPSLKEPSTNPSTSRISTINKSLQNSDLRIAFGSTLDELSEPETIVQGGGVPSLALRDDGTLIAAFQWFPEDNEESFDQIATITSTDSGRTWSEPAPIVIQGYPTNNQRPFDPTIINAGNGTLRMYFSSSPGKTTRAIHSAISTDGITFTYEGENLGQAGIEYYDSAIAQFNETWHMLTPWAPDLGAYHATSTDGITFEAQEHISDDQLLNWTGNMTIVDESLYFFGTGTLATNFSPWYRTTTDMMTWSEPEIIDFDKGGDPATIHLPNEGWIVVSVVPR